MSKDKQREWWGLQTPSGDWWGYQRNSTGRGPIGNAARFTSKETAIAHREHGPYSPLNGYCALRLDTDPDYGGID